MLKAVSFNLNQKMIYNTAGNRIYEPIYTCNCGLTGGCENCRPPFIGSITDKEAEGQETEKVLEPSPDESITPPAETEPEKEEAGV